jgi:hypothetical protein
VSDSLESGGFYAMLDDLNAPLQETLTEPVSVIGINHLPMP